MSNYATPSPVDALAPATSALDDGKSGQQLLAERMQRVEDCVALRQPDRIPVMMPASYFLAEYSGITRQELHEDPARSHAALEKAALDFQPDIILGPIGGPEMIKYLGDRSWKYPGHGLGPNETFQYVEGEYLKADEYDDFLLDPGDWGVRTYLPRVFSKLGGLAQLRHLALTTFGGLGFNLPVLFSPEMTEALDALKAAAAAQITAGGHAAAAMQRMLDLGFPPPIFFSGGFAAAPFDAMSDTLRGMRGVMLDIHQRPEKLLAAIEKMRIIITRDTFDACRAMNAHFAGSMLHRGSDGFMSLKQFEKFYWPSLKQMWLDFIEGGVTPFAFYEGAWDQRLSYLAELPKGKTVGWFQSSDIFKVKEVLGDTMCILGGMPNSLLKNGTVAEVRAHTKRVCEEVGRGGGFIMCTGVGEMEGSKPDLVRAWIDAVHEFGVY
jgi:hypothetical protein